MITLSVVQLLAWILIHNAILFTAVLTPKQCLGQILKIVTAEKFLKFFFKKNEI